jgi:hypothetical protein
MRRRFLPLVPLIAVAAGCGGGSGTASAPKPNAPEVNPAGDIPDNQVYVRYAPPGGGFSVRVPEGWARTAAGGAVTFTDKLNAVRMESARASAPLGVAEARGMAPGGAMGVKASAVSRSAGPATRLTYLARSAPDPVTGKTRLDAVERYTFFRGGRRVVLTLSGPKGADNVDPWRIVTDSLRFTR